MTKKQIQIEYDIKDTVANFKLTPYRIVKKNLDAAARKTRKALGISLRTSKRANG